jgi:lysophospholipase L1-like esterase
MMGLVSLIVFMILGIQALSIFQARGKVSHEQLPFQQIRPQARVKILFLGDSTAVGTGSEDPRTSVAGWLGRDFPQASIRNISRNGRKLSGVVEEFPSLPVDHYRLIIVQAGANDIIHWTPFSKIEDDLNKIIADGRRVADYVVLLHSGNVGSAPIFTWPLNWFYSLRSQKARRVYQRLADGKKVFYIDLIGLNTDQVLSSDWKMYYAKDRFHLSGAGYQIWYQAIRKKLQEMNIRV